MIGRKRVLNEDAISHFIWCVRKRPPLYNYKLPPQQRRRVDVARIWQELANEIGNVTAADCRKKWKNLRDTYHQYRLRKLKYKECLEKWRYTQDLAFLTDIYQPKLKSERSKYLNSSQNSSTIHEVKAAEISSMIELDEETTTHYQDPDQDSEDIVIDEHEFEENIEHVIDMNEVQFCDVSEEKLNHVVMSEDSTYGEVHLYDDTDSNVEVDSLVLPINQMDRKDNIIKESHTNYKVLDIPSAESTPPPPCEDPTIGNTNDELDLFFQFLKTKIQKLPSMDITAIQIEFLNAVLRRESACASKEHKCSAS